MKIGILTFHKAENYGAFLQCYALCQVITGILGEKDTVEVIDYNPHYFKNTPNKKTQGNITKKISLRTRVFSTMTQVRNLPSFVKRKIRFRLALKMLNISHEIYSLNRELEQAEYDVVVLGSDQIWNPRITCGIDVAFWGEPFSRSATKIISYAASIGVSELSESEIELIKHLISTIDVVSVRETSAISMLETIAARDYASVLDPVFLIPQSRWGQIAKASPPKEDYILIYMLENNAELVQTAKAEANRRECACYHFREAGLLSSGKNPVMRSVYDAGPLEFLACIRNATMVFTDSYHAVCFSLIFRKSFISWPHELTGNRVYDLSWRLGFEDRVIGNGKSEMNENLCTMSYDGIDERLRIEILRSKEYLTNALRIDPISVSWSSK